MTEQGWLFAKGPVIERESCPVCSGDEWKTIEDSHGLWIVECLRCGYRVIAAERVVP